MNMKRASTPLLLLVPKLCLGTHLSSKLCFAAGATELPGHWHWFALSRALTLRAAPIAHRSRGLDSQTEFGNEEKLTPTDPTSDLRPLTSDF